MAGSPAAPSRRLSATSAETDTPEFVITPPFRPTAGAGEAPVIREDFREVSPAYYAVKKSLEAVQEELGAQVSVVLDLPLLGMDDPTDESTPASVSEAVEEALHL